jgi:hypothetical protein
LIEVIHEEAANRDLCTNINEDADRAEHKGALLPNRPGDRRIAPLDREGGNGRPRNKNGEDKDRKRQPKIWQFH